MAGADRMTCVIYQTRGARPQEKNRPPHDKAPGEPSSTHNEGMYKVDGLCELRGGLTAWRRRGLVCATLPQYVSSTQWSKESVRSYETTATTIREKKRARMKRTGESRGRQRLPDILSITIIGFST
ncbi:hypothetical protein Q5P01_018375 [Channa striata]|uniref:Uncharacterized protein n=1 Tax=Channa striata TaxID=64152 RepID=A0AA88M4S5_CHASR|nr:hypothetical protein Q5P01_018375 [Channa striata]